MTTNFGFRKIPVDTKQTLVDKVFKGVAPRYDIMNDLMSGFLHRWWKNYFVEKCIRPTANSSIIEVAGGTGDVSFRVLKSWHRARSKNCTLVITDINKAMLQEAERRATECGYHPCSNIDFKFREANAERLEDQFHESSFDSFICAFGMRNVPDLNKALAQAHRVLKNGGTFHCLEFSQVTCPGLSTLYDAYSFQAIPVLGKLVADDWDSYQYLVESIRMFPSQEAFSARIASSGFSNVKYTNLSGGIVAIHTGIKVDPNYKYI